MKTKLLFCNKYFAKAFHTSSYKYLFVTQEHHEQIPHTVDQFHILYNFKKWMIYKQKLLYVAYSLQALITPTLHISLQHLLKLLKIF